MSKYDAPSVTLKLAGLHFEHSEDETLKIYFPDAKVLENPVLEFTDHTFQWMKENEIPESVIHQVWEAARDGLNKAMLLEALKTIIK